MLDSFRVQQFWILITMTHLSLRFPEGPRLRCFNLAQIALPRASCPAPCATIEKSLRIITLIVIPTLLILSVLISSLAPVGAQGAGPCQGSVFRLMPNISVGKNPVAVVIGDFNGDGQRDLAIASNGSDNVSILLGDR